jgi:hypothetical protein
LLPGIGGGGGRFGLWDGRVASERAKGIEREEVGVFFANRSSCAAGERGEQTDTEEILSIINKMGYSQTSICIVSLYPPVVCQGMPTDLRCGWEFCQNSIYTPGIYFHVKLGRKKKRKLMMSFFHTGFTISLGYLELEHLQRSPKTSSNPIFKRWNLCFGLQ